MTDVPEMVRSVSDVVGRSLDEQYPDGWLDPAAVVRAVGLGIGAMREPTRAMSEAGLQAAWTQPTEAERSEGILGTCNPVECYQAFIDAALNGSPEPTITIPPGDFTKEAVRLFNATNDRLAELDKEDA